MMTTKMKQSRQARALVQREAEFKVWSNEGADAQEMMERCRNQKKSQETGLPSLQGKASTASREITALKTKLGVRSEA